MVLNLLEVPIGHFRQTVVLIWDINFSVL